MQNKSREAGHVIDRTLTCVLRHIREISSTTEGKIQYTRLVSSNAVFPLMVQNGALMNQIRVCAYYFVLGIDIKLHPAVLPLLSPLGRSLSLQVQLGPIEVLIEMSMTQWWFGINT